MSNEEDLVIAPRFIRTDRDASEVLALVRVEDKDGNVITSSFSDVNEDRTDDYPYLVQITSGPELGDDFVGLYGLDGERVETGNGWTWEITPAAPAAVVAAVEHGWETGTNTVARLETYTIRYLDSSGVSTSITCTPEKLDEAVADDVRSGNYPTDVTQYVDVEVTKEGDTEGDRRTIVIEIPEPECADGHEHDWQSPIKLVGGIPENPGVWGNGGGVKIHEVCCHCGAHRHTDTWATRMDTGEQGLTEVSYAAADDETLAWVASQTATAETE